MNSADQNNRTFFEELNNAELVNQNSFERLRSKNLHKEIRRRIFYFLISMILIVLIGIVCVVIFFGLKNVEVRGNSRYSANEILSVCGFTSRTNLFGINFKEKETEIVKQYPYIRDVRFQRVLPSTLILTVTEDTPSYCTEIYGNWFLLSDDLRVISRHDHYEDIAVLDLPVTYLLLPDIDYAVAGEIIRFEKASTYEYLTDFLNELSSLPFYRSVNCVDARNRYHMALYAENGRFYVELGNSDSLETKLRFVAKVIEDPSFDERTIASINVEYVSQIIVLRQDKLFQYR